MYRSMTLARRLIAGLWLGLFVLAGGLSAVADEADIRIVRDTYGIPHIYADDTYSLFYGYGYAVGQDRLFQMEMIKRTTAGRVAEVMGSDYIDLDIRVRQGFAPASLHQQLQDLTPQQSQVFAGYAAGLNRWIAEVNKDPSALLPKEFIDFGFRPSAWTAYDVVLVFAGSIAHRYADFNEEIDNLAFYQALLKQHGPTRAWAIFNATLPLYHPASPTTVPDSEASQRDVQHTGAQAPAYLQDLLKGKISSPPRAAFALDGSLRSFPASQHKGQQTSQQRRSYLHRQLAHSGLSGRAGFSSASNIWLVNRQKLQDAQGVLVNGPQFGWINPSYVYGVGLHGAGYNVVGNTLLAFPFLLFAHNKDISWGSTAGFGDLVDIYVNRLNPANPDEYLYQGSYHPLESRQETIKVKGQAALTQTFYRTVHGPVILLDEEAGLVYSKRRTWEGSEVATGIAWVELARARDYQAWRAYLARMSLNINFYFLDKAGNIAYTHTGKYPQRTPGHDSRLPVPGDGALDWQGYLPFAENPHVYNPQQGFIINWNNRPERNWRSSDLWWANWSRAHRARVLFDELEAKDSFTPDELWEMNRRASFADVNIAYLLPWLNKALEQGEHAPAVARALALLNDWDRYWRDDDKDGYYDSAAPLLMESWLRRLLELVMKDDIGEQYFHRFAAPGYPKESIQAAISVSPGVKAIIDTLNNDSNAYDFFNAVPAETILRESFTATVNELAQSYGDDMDAWRLQAEPLVFRSFNFRGAPQTTEDQTLQLPLIMNRGSENNQFIADGSRIQGRDVFAPGQSGFIAPDGSRSPHYADQMSLYRTFSAKPLPFTQDEVQAMKASEQVLHID